MILIYVQNANPYYDDSYDVDSANVGPYGTAINDELIPAIEKKYRGIGQGWARATFGGSTGGWEAAATQVFYPDFYNGAWVACPDPVDFHAYQNIDLYEDANAFVRKGDFGEVPIAADRKPDGSIIAEAGAEYAFEYVLGTHGRSTEQWDIWQAVFSPAGADGYPAQVIDPLTGAIDRKVVEYWNRALRSDRDPEARLAHAGAEARRQAAFCRGRRRHVLPEQCRAPVAESNWTPRAIRTRTRRSSTGRGCRTATPAGLSEYTMQENNADWTQRVLPQMVEHMLATAPEGADTKSWRY